MHIARADLRLDRLRVVHPGDEECPLQDWAAAISLPRLLDLLRQPRWA